MICYPLLREMIEHKRLRILGFPSRITSEDIYHNLLRLRSARICAEYLSGLRRRQVLLIGEVMEPPAELLRNPLVAEELARLWEQWFGFVNVMGERQLYTQAVFTRMQRYEGHTSQWVASRAYLPRDVLSKQYWQGGRRGIPTRPDAEIHL